MANQIKFFCLKCGACCKIGGYVFLKKGEAEKIAAKLVMPVKEFKKKNTKWILWYGTSLKSTESGACIFLKDNKCSVYESRPEQCSSWPYWKKIMENKEDLLIAKIYCKGIE